MLTKVFSSKKQVKYTGNTKKSNEALDMPLDEIVLVVESIKLDLDVLKKDTRCLDWNTSYITIVNIN